MLGDPWRAHADFGNGPEPALLMSWGPGPTTAVVDRISENVCLVARGDGTLHELSRDFVTIDFRYIEQADRWLDLTDGSTLGEEASPGP